MKYDPIRKGLIVTQKELEFCDEHIGNLVYDCYCPFQYCLECYKIVEVVEVEE